MRDSSCPSLQRLALLLLETYALRTKAEAKGDYPSLFLAERDLSRANRLLTRHRDLCLRCKFADDQRKSPRQEIIRSPKVTSISRVC
jgi:hypothetical protein